MGADHNSQPRGKHDQLNMIFNLLGTPGEEDVDQLEREDSMRYIRCFKQREGDGLRSKLPAMGADEYSLLMRMLRFSAQSRITVSEALEHALFAGTDAEGRRLIRDPSVESKAPSTITLSFEREPDLDEVLLRRYFSKEIQRYHPEVPL